MRAWYVIGVDPDYVNVFGPFNNEMDARAYAIDEAQENGWLHIDAYKLTAEDAADIATENVLYPYDQDGEES